MYENVYALRKSERAQLLDEKSIPASTTDVSWAAKYSIPHSVLKWFLLGSYSVPSPHGRFLNRASPKVLNLLLMLLLILSY
jgi:hypothetical protein